MDEPLLITPFMVLGDNNIFNIEKIERIKFIEPGEGPDVLAKHYGIEFKFTGNPEIYYVAWTKEQEARKNWNVILKSIGEEPVPQKPKRSLNS